MVSKEEEEVWFQIEQDRKEPRAIDPMADGERCMAGGICRIPRQVS